MKLLNSSENVIELTELHEIMNKGCKGKKGEINPLGIERKNDQSDAINYILEENLIDRDRL